jgi:non-heme chloroperoxidase
VVLVGAVPPVMLKSDSNPEGTPMDVFDSIREGTAKNRAQFFLDLTTPFYGLNRDGAPKLPGMQEKFWLQGMAGSIKGHYDCIREFSEVDYSEDLKKIDVPTLVIHGSDDQIVPIAASAEKAVKLLPQGELLVIEGGSHGLAEIDPDTFNQAVDKFIR